MSRGYGTSSSNKNVTTYFRHSFNLNQSDLSGNDYWINLLRDDAAVIYLNGVEIARMNIGSPGIVPAWNELSPLGHEALLFQNEF